MFKVNQKKKNKKKTEHHHWRRSGTFLLLILNILRTFIWCFYRWLWTNKSALGSLFISNIAFEDRFVWYDQHNNYPNF